MIEDAGPYISALLGIIVMFCLLVWLRNRAGLNEMQTGHLYMLYFFGAHTAYEIMNEIDATEYTTTAVYWDLKHLEQCGFVERDPSLDKMVGRYSEYFVMTDAGEAAYKKYAKRWGMDYVEDENKDQMDPRQIYKNARPA